MISKKIGQDFAQYRGGELRLTRSSVTPTFVDEVVVGLRGDKKFKRKVVIFRDEKFKPIEKVFDYSDQPVLKNRVYSFENNFIGNDEFVTSTNVKEYSLDKNIVSVANQKRVQDFDIVHILFDRLSSVTNHFSENFRTGETILSQVKIVDSVLPNTELHVFKEFPRIIDGKKDASKQKELSYLVDRFKNQVVKHSELEKGARLPMKDSFLAFRAMDVEDIKEPIIRRFLKERGLQRLNTPINVDFEPVAGQEDLIAIYSDVNGAVNFNKCYKFASKTDCVGTAKHESEHVWQYFLKALYTGGHNERTCLLAKANEQLLKNPRILKEAEEYTGAIADYVPFNKDFKLYKSNLIERKADAAEIIAEERYDREGEVLRKTFKHIPPKFL